MAKTDHLETVLKQKQNQRVSRQFMLLFSEGQRFPQGAALPENWQLLSLFPVSAVRLSVGVYEKGNHFAKQFAKCSPRIPDWHGKNTFTLVCYSSLAASIT